MKKYYFLLLVYFMFSNAIVAQIDFDKFEQTGKSAWKRREYQHAINNYLATLTYPMSPEKNQQIRDTISVLEEEYRKYLMLQRNFSRRMERSNELVLQAMQAYEQRKYELALQLAHYACKISNNTNILALRCRSYYLSNSRFEPLPPSKPNTNISIDYQMSPLDSSKSILIINERDSKDLKKFEIDTLSLDIPPIISISSLSHEDELIAVCNNGKAYWVNIKSGKVEVINPAMSDLVMSAAVWSKYAGSNIQEHYALGYKSGLILVYSNGSEPIFKHTAAGPVNYIDFCDINISRKGKKILMLTSANKDAQLLEIKIKKGEVTFIPQLLAKEVLTAKISRNRKMITVLFKNNGIQFYSGTGRPTGDIKYPFTATRDSITIKDIIISPDNESILVKILKFNYLEKNEEMVIEEVDKSGRVKNRKKNNSESKKEDKPFINLRNISKDNKYIGIAANQFCFFQGGTRLAYLNTTQDSVFVVTTSNPNIITAKFGREGGTSITKIVTDPTGKYILASTNNTIMYLFNLLNNQRQLLPHSSTPVIASSFSGRGDYFISADREKINLHSLPGGQVIRFSAFADTITALTCSPTGDTIMIGFKAGDVAYVLKNELGNILTTKTSKAQGPVTNVSFSRLGKKALLLARDKKEGKIFLEIINNDPTNLGADRRYYYDTGEEIDINHAEFSFDDDLILLAKKNETLLLSSNFLKPEYEVQSLISPHRNEEIKEAYLLENDRYIATISNGGKVWLQANPIAYLDREMEELSILEQIKYKVADPDSLMHYASTKEELERSLTYLSEYYSNEEDQKDHIRDITIEILIKRLSLSDSSDIEVTANHFLALARLFENQSYELYERLEPEPSLKKMSYALKCTHETQLRTKSVAFKKQVTESQIRIYTEMAKLSICLLQLTEAKIYADSVEILRNSTAQICDTNKSNQALITLLSGKSQEAYRVFNAHKNEKCSVQMGRETLKSVFLSDLEYLALVFKGKPGVYKNHVKAVNSAIKYLNQL